MEQLISYKRTSGFTIQRAEILVFQLHSQNNYLIGLVALQLSIWIKDASIVLLCPL